MTPEEIAQQESIKRMSEGQNTAAKTMQRLVDVMEDLEDDVKRRARIDADATKSFLSFERAVKSGKTRWVDATETIAQLAEQIEEVTDADKKRELEKKLDYARDKSATAQRNKFLVDSFGELAKGVFNAGTGITKSVINSYQSGANAFETFGDATNAGLDATNNSVQGVAKAGAAGALALGALGVVSGGTAVALAAVVGVAAEVFNSFNDLAKYGISVAVKEITATADAYSKATKAGAVFTDGINGIRNGAAEAGLTMTQMAKLISENSPGLAQYGGTVTRGMEAFKQLNKAMLPARTGLIALGYSIEEISAGTMEYMATIGSVSNRQRTDYTNLAKETDQYLTNLKVISAFTGKDAKKAEEEAQRRSTQAAVQAKIMRSANPEQELLRYKNALKMAGPGMEDAVDQLYVTGTAVGEAGLALSQLPATANTIYNIVDTIGDNSLSLKDQTTKLIGIQKENIDIRKQENIQASDQIGRVAILGGGLDKQAEIYSQQTEFANRISKLSGLSADEFQKQVLAIKEQGKKTDTDTGRYADLVVKGQQLHVRMQQELDVVITQFQKFAKVSDAVINGIQDALEKAGFAVGGPIPTANRPGMENTGGGAATGGAKVGSKPIAGPGAASGRTLMPAGTITKELTDVLSNSVFSNLVATSLNDKDHVAGSKHYEGKAADFSVKGLSPEEVISKITAIKQLGIEKVWAEDKSESTDWAKSIIQAGGNVKAVGKASAPHIHMELMAKGGITSGPSIAGEAGPEAVVPLPDGRNIPVRMDTSELVAKLEELINVAKDQRDNSERMLHAVQ